VIQKVPLLNSVPNETQYVRGPPLSDDEEECWYLTTPDPNNQGLQDQAGTHDLLLANHSDSPWFYGDEGKNTAGDGIPDGEGHEMDTA
jgi:hypothetical protein